MRKIRKGDRVQVLSGKDKGRSGKVLQVMPAADKKSCMVIVENINLKTHYQKANPQREIPAAMTKKEAAMHGCKVAVLGNDDKPCRVGFKEVDGKKVRISRRSGEVIHG